METIVGRASRAAKHVVSYEDEYDEDGNKDGNEEGRKKKEKGKTESKPKSKQKATKLSTAGVELIDSEYATRLLTSNNMLPFEDDLCMRGGLGVKQGKKLYNQMENNNEYVH